MPGGRTGWSTPDRTKHETCRLDTASIAAASRSPTKIGSAWTRSLMGRFGSLLEIGAAFAREPLDINAVE